MTDKFIDLSDNKDWEEEVVCMCNNCNTYSNVNKLLLYAILQCEILHYGLAGNKITDLET